MPPDVRKVFDFPLCASLIRGYALNEQNYRGAAQKI